jgi:hypothetical protein
MPVLCRSAGSTTKSTRGVYIFIMLCAVTAGNAGSRTLLWTGTNLSPKRYSSSMVVTGTAVIKTAVLNTAGPLSCIKVQWPRRQKSGRLATVWLLCGNALGRPRNLRSGLHTPCRNSSPIHTLSCTTLRRSTINQRQAARHRTSPSRVHKARFLSRLATPKPAAESHLRSGSEDSGAAVCNRSSEPCGRNSTTGGGPVLTG